MNRTTVAGHAKGGWYPKPHLVEAALRHYTQDAAYASFNENDKGTIAVGKFADFVVLSEDLPDDAARENHGCEGAADRDGRPRNLARAGVRRVSGASTGRRRPADPRIQAGAGPSGAALDAVHAGVLGTLRVLRNTLGTGAVHRGRVPRRQRHGPVRHKPDLRARSSRARLRRAIFGGYVADRIIGYQRSILVGAVFMSAGLFMIMWPDPTFVQRGLATIVVGNGLPSRTSRRWSASSTRSTTSAVIPGSRSSYMGINVGALIAPIVTGWFATSLFGTGLRPSTSTCSARPGIGMLVERPVWFYIGRRLRNSVGRPRRRGPPSGVPVAIGALCAIPVVFLLLSRRHRVAVRAERAVRRLAVMLLAPASAPARSPATRPSRCW